MLGKQQGQLLSQALGSPGQPDNLQAGAAVRGVSSTAESKFRSCFKLSLEDGTDLIRECLGWQSALP